MSVKGDAENEANEGSAYESPPEAASTPSSTGQPSDGSTNNDTSRPPPRDSGYTPPMSSYEDVDSGNDSDAEFDLPGWDGIRRRKRTPGQTRIRPAYYYPLDPAVAGSSAKQGSRGVPVFEPTMDEFRDFYDYIQKIDNYGMRSGIVKVVPPKEWLDSLPDEKEKLKMTRIRSPIAEVLHGSGGLFRQTNLTRSRHFNAKQWKDLSETPKYAMPDFFGTGDPVEIAEARRAGKRDQSKAAKAARAAQKAANEASKVAPSLEDDEKPTAKGTDGEDAINSNDMQIDEPSKPDAPPTPNEKHESKPAKTPKTHSSPAVRADVDDDEWEGFDYKSMMHGLKVEHFTVENCSDVEKRYWRTLTFGEPPMYGADLEGSLFTEQTKNWNVANLGDLLKRLCPYSVIPGVTQPYLYFGMWRATFSWHVEDADLYSINYIHFGAPKFWYSVPQAQYERFERIMANFFPTDRKRCTEFLRHKSFLASPKKLADQGITLNRCVQHAGEFIITYPKGYHSGFNVGFNCAESINFATERWIEYGKLAKACKCVPDSVRLDVDALLADARRDALTDPSVREAIPERYREGPIAEEYYMPPPKRLKLDPYSAEAMAQAEQRRLQRAAIKAAKDAETQAKEAARAKKEERLLAQHQAKKDAQERQRAYVCCLCPETSRVSLVRLGKVEGKQAKDPKRALGHAHKLCAIFVPETSVDLDPDTGEEVVYGVENVEKARWNLKCQVCSEKHGAKIQCVKGKCSRAYHVTCAIKESSGAFLDAIIGEGPNAIKLIGDTIKEGGLTALDVFASASQASEEEEEGVYASDQPPLPTSPSQNATQTAEREQAEASHPPSNPTAPHTEISQNEEPAAPDIDPLDSMQHVLLCRQHNPDWAKNQAQNRIKAAWDRAQTLPLDSTIKVKVGGGIFAVTLTGFLPEKNSIEVIFEDGKQDVCKATAIVYESKGTLPKGHDAALSRSGSTSRSRGTTLSLPPTDSAPASLKTPTGALAET